MAKKKKYQRPIEMTCSRVVWERKPQTQVVQNKKGKGSYSRQAFKKGLDY